jgi:hypothetical protein
MEIGNRRTAPGAAAKMTYTDDTIAAARALHEVGRTDYAERAYRTIVEAFGYAPEDG